MKEISQDYVDQYLAQIDRSPFADFSAILDKASDDVKKVLPIAIDLFVNKFKLRNPIHFLDGILRLPELSERDLSHITKGIGEARKVLDVGCGWGIFTKMLCKDYEEVVAVDWALEHAIATKALSPEARVYHGDARDMHLLGSEYFDAVIAKDLIEHVGDVGKEAAGKSVKNFHHQYRLVKELSRVCKLDGRVFLSTGNYVFPGDGETHLWFYHWLPTERKVDWCDRKGVSTDNYWLLNWAELDFLLSLCGLSAESVSTPDTDLWDRMFVNHLEKCFEGIDPDMVEVWRNLIHNEPQFFSSWQIVARKTGVQRDIYGKNNRCYYHRALYFDEPCLVAAEVAQLKKTLDEISVRDVMRKRALKLVERLCSSHFYTSNRAKLPEPVIRLAKKILPGGL